jgi:hypothetical protein
VCHALPMTTTRTQTAQHLATARTATLKGAAATLAALLLSNGTLPADELRALGLTLAELKRRGA